MPLNRALVGRTWKQARPERIDAARVADFAAATGAADALPPMFACALGMGAWTAPLLDPELQCELMRVSIERYDLSLLKPLEAVGEFESSCELLEIADSGWGDRMRLARVTTSGGAEVARAETALRFRKAPRGTRTRELIDAERAEEAAVVEAFRALPLRFTAERTVSLAHCARFAAAIGDPNPVRFDAEAATMAGLPAPIAHELLTLSLLHEVTAAELGPLSRVSARFSMPVLPGDTIRFECRGEERAVCAWNQSDELVVRDGEVES